MKIKELIEFIEPSEDSTKDKLNILLCRDVLRFKVVKITDFQLTDNALFIEAHEELDDSASDLFLSDLPPEIFNNENHDKLVKVSLTYPTGEFDVFEDVTFGDIGQSSGHFYLEIEE